MQRGDKPDGALRRLTLDQMAGLADFATAELGGLSRREFTKLVGAAAGMTSATSLSGCVGGGGGGGGGGENTTWEEIEADIEGQLTVNTFGGSLGDAIKEVWIGPFEEKYDVDVTTVTGKEANHAAIVQAVNSGNSPGMDVSFHQLPGYLNMVQEDVLQPLPAEQIPVKEELFDVCQKEYGLGNIFYTTGIAYNEEEVDPTPTHWNDMWKDEHAGNVSTVISNPEWNLEIANLARGADMYPWNQKTWDKLWEVRPHIPALSFKGAETNKMFREGTITMSTWWNGRTYALRDEGFPVEFLVPEEGAIPRYDPYVVYKTTENPNAAKAYINFILQKDQQKAFAERIYYAATNKNVTYSKKLKRKCIPNSSEQMEQMRIEDWDYIFENKPDIISRFEDWQEGER